MNIYEIYLGRPCAVFKNRSNFENAPLGTLLKYYEIFSNILIFVEFYCFVIATSYKFVLE